MLDAASTGKTRFREPTLTRASERSRARGKREGRAAPASSRAAARLGEGKGAAFGAAPPSWWKPSGMRLLAAGAASEVYGWHTWPPSPVHMLALHGPMQLVVKQLVVAELQLAHHGFVLP